MFSSQTRTERLQRLRLDYRSAFREWASAERMLHAPAGEQPQAQQRAEAAEQAYLDARNDLTEEMLAAEK